MEFFLALNNYLLDLKKLITFLSFDWLKICNPDAKHNGRSTNKEYNLQCIKNNTHNELF